MGYEMVAVSSPGPELDRIKDEDGFRCVPVAMERHISLTKDLKSLWRMIRVFRKEHPYMVHSITPKAGLICMLAAWITRVPRRVHTFTGLVWPTTKGVKRRILMFTDWLTCVCATHIIPEGQGVMNDLRNGAITHKPMKVLGYGNVRGVDMERFSPLRIVSHKDSTMFTFVFVGRIVRDKGINELVEAFMRISCQYKTARLILVGNYENELDPVDEATHQMIESNCAINACGTKHGDDLVQVYADADCFVMPSYREGFPNTVLEAGAMGLPSIVTDINGSREIITDGENGLVVPARNADALYEAMLRMMTDDRTRTRMSQVARPIIASRYERSFVQKCQIDFYKDIISKDR